MRFQALFMVTASLIALAAVARADTTVKIGILNDRSGVQAQASGAKIIGLANAGRDTINAIKQAAKDEEFDNAEQIIKEAGLPVFYVPGEHDVLDEERGKSYLGRYGKNAKGAGWQSFDLKGVHYIGLVNVLDLKAGGLGNLGPEQLDSLEKDVQGLSPSTPIVIFAHIPLWTVYPEWGWGTEDGAKVLSLLKRFGSVTVLNGHIHQIMQKVEGNVAFHTARSTAFPQPAMPQLRQSRTRRFSLVIAISLTGALASAEIEPALCQDVRITGIAAQTLFKSLPGDAQVDPNHRFQSKVLELERIPVKNDISEEVTVLGCRREINKPETTICWLRTILAGD